MIIRCQMKGQTNLAGHPSQSRRSSFRGLGVGPWTLGLGYEASDSANTRLRSAKTRSMRQVLPHLTLEDLKEIGVATVGDRRKLLAAIGALIGSTPFARAPDSPILDCTIDHTTNLGRTPPDHSHVLRSRRVDKPGREARRRGLAQSRQRLSRRSVKGGDRFWRPCAEEARRRADGAVRLSSRAGERR